MGVDDGSGTYSSIDPAALKGASDGLKKTTDGITNDLWPLRSQFLEYGVSTGNLDKLHGFSQTLAGMTPQLDRRHNLAVQLLLENPSMGKLATYQGDLLGPFKTTADAQKQAKIDAAALKKNGVNGTTGADLEKYGMDPDYAAALVKELGPKGMSDVLFGNSRMDDDPNSRSSKAISNWLATASYQHPFDKAYLDQVRDKAGVQFPLEMFQPYLNNGKWSEKTLSAFADLRFKPHPGDQPYFLDTDQSLEQSILKGMSNNPTAAADYFSKNHDLMYNMARANGSPGKFQIGTTSDRWAEFMQAATVTARNQFGTKYLSKPGDNPAIQNAQWLIHKAANDKVDWKSKMRVSFANISAEYVDDFAYTVGSPIDPGSVNDPGRDGVNNSTADWTAFLKQAMSDNTGMVIVGSALQKKMDDIEGSTSGSIKSGRNANNNPDMTADANGWSHYTIGAMQSIFQHDYNAVLGDRKQSAEDQQAALGNIVDKGLDFATDPSGTVEDIGKEFVGGLLKSAINSQIHPEKLPPMPDGFDAQRDYADFAVRDLSSGGRDFVPYKDGDVTWDGKTDIYTKPSPPCGDFTKYIGDGKMDYDKLKKDPAAWTSFNSWLQDPAVAANTFPQYHNSTTGALGGGSGG